MRFFKSIIDFFKRKISVFKFFKKEKKEKKDTNTDNLKSFYIKSIGLIFFMLIIAVSFFLFVVRGEEQTMVPDVQGIELTEALLELQVKELYPRIQLRYSESSRDKGIILEQDPPPGTIVKAGRRIRLVVSQGILLNRIENYVGRKIYEVQAELQSHLLESGSPMYIIREPIIYDYSTVTPGTILGQRPEPGTEVFGQTRLEFIVSRGEENILHTVPQLTGLTLSAALELIGKTDILVDFSLRKANEGERGEIVVLQNPEAGEDISGDTVINITLTEPQELREGEIFDIFIHTTLKNPYPLPLRLEAEIPTGERRLLFTTDFPGGKISIPYKLPVDSVLILTMMNREILRQTVKGDF